MAPEARLRAAGLRQTLVTYRDLLGSHRELLNRLNVYPVPDGDTGTNMALTLEAVVGELEEATEPLHMADVCKAMSHGSLMGARGNSGVILSQLLRGIGDVVGGCEEVGSPELARALATASDMARSAVVRPVEGTILTVADGAARGAADALSGPPEVALVEVAQAAHDRASRALQSTPDLLPALARAGVVDAGGAGYVLLLDALLCVLDQRPAPEPSKSASAPSPASSEVRPEAGSPDVDSSVRDGATPVEELRYEVMYLLEGSDEAIPAFKEVWAGLGDSIVVVGGNGMWNCHIHTDDIGASIEAALDVGRPRSIRVTDLLEQVEEERWVLEGEAAEAAEATGEPLRPGPPPVTAVVAVASGAGVGRIFRSLGAFGLVGGGQSDNPSTAQLVEAVEATGSAEVVLLPNNANVRAVADQVPALVSRPVLVVPTTSTVEGFAALLAYDPDATGEENAAEMRASAQRVLSGEVTRAVRQAETEAGSVKEGDWLGVRHGRVVVIDHSAPATVCALLEAMVTPAHELVTVIEGEGATAAMTRQISEWLHDAHPDVAVEVHHGGQPLYPYLVGVE